MLKQKTAKFFLALLTGLLLIVLFFNNNFFDVLRNFSKKIFLNNQPITYSLGEFDNRFGLSREDFLKDIDQATQIWESAAGKKLFAYQDKGVLKINLIYDERQATSDKLKESQAGIDEAALIFEAKKNGYEGLNRLYKIKKASFDKQVNDYEIKKQAYEQKVAEARTKPMSQAELNNLNSSRNALNNLAIKANQEQKELNSLVNQLNSLAGGANQLLPQLNSDITDYNNLADQASQEFQEGEYVSGFNSRVINVYQFDNEDMLVALLAHELGHALGLEHIDDPEAIMYKLNYSKPAKLSSSDLEALRKAIK